MQSDELLGSWTLAQRLSYLLTIATGHRQILKVGARALVGQQVLDYAVACRII